MAKVHMTTAAAQAARRPSLEAALRQAACAVPGAPDWHRAEGESATRWKTRSVGLVATCRRCPALAACRELALREDAAPAAGQIRAGATAHELTRLRREERERVAEAVRADVAARTDRARFLGAVGRLRRQACATSPTYTSTRGAYRAAAALERTLAARRQQIGWGTSETDRPPLPMRPTPHERDGRQPLPTPGRPHAARAGLLDEIETADDQAGPEPDETETEGRAEHRRNVTCHRTCCGRPMYWDGSMWMCSKCHGSDQPYALATGGAR
ncbi:hypothetical protein [Streptomyces buecherae]|uniref:4Fe-4S Wbl-type domain-containing protein n=1 Tax=Streptomyces buecherae TaxID=2763006 RepID=A0A7H8NKX9_9ACTN|nr:hypothetical protein [Streptomyces buecherae]QKW55035.1 hypothetical protein HUT08_36510 [Streptomyces buecherae]